MIRLNNGYTSRLFHFLFQKKDNEIQALNGIRALSISLIFIVHTWGFALPILPPELQHSTTSRIFLNTNSGVDLFLLLSGFLISLGLKQQWKKTGTLDIRLFYKKRILRIFPAYYVFILVTTLLLFASHTPFRLNGILIDALYLSNYLPGQLPHTWSLALEEQFYLLFPFLAQYVLFKVNYNKRILLLFILYAIPVSLRTLIFLGGVESYQDFSLRIYNPAHTRFDSIVAGILLMEIYTEKNNWFSRLNGRISFLLFSLALILLYLGHNSYYTPDSINYHITRFNFINSGFSVLFIIALGKNRLNRFFSSGFFRPIARTSYTMYLWQFIFGGIGARLTPGLNFSVFSWSSYLYGLFSVFFFNFLFSILLFGLVEYPFLRKKEMLNKTRI